MSDGLKPWVRLERRELFALPPRVRVWLDRVQLPDGQIIDDYVRVRLEDAVIVFAETTEGKVITLRQYRYGAERVVLNFPGGHRDPDEDWQACAARELLEETGYEAADWQDLGQYVHNDNRGCGVSHFFRAGGCRKVAPIAAGDLEETELLTLTRDELLAAGRAGEFATVSHLALLALATHPDLKR